MGSSNNMLPALGYRFLTNFYDLIIKVLMPNKFRSKFIQLIDVKENQKILDFGTGTSEIAILLKKNNANINVVGIDTDSKILEIAKRKIKKTGYNIQLKLYNGEQLPFENDSFDKVVECLVFCNLSLQQQEICLNEIYRVLKPNGCFYLCDYGYEKIKAKRFVFDFLRMITPFRKLLVDSDKQLYEQIEKTRFKEIAFNFTIKTITSTLYYFKATK